MSVSLFHLLPCREVFQSAMCAPDRAESMTNTIDGPWRTIHEGLRLQLLLTNVFSTCSFVSFALSRARSRTSQKWRRCTSRTRLKPLWTSARTSTPASSTDSCLCVRRAPGCSSRVTPPHPEVVGQTTLPYFGVSPPSFSLHKLLGSKTARKRDGSRPARGSWVC